MTYTVFYRASAERDLKALQNPVQTDIRKAINALAVDPRPPGSRKLVEMSGAYRIRVGKYRIGYLIEDRRVIVTVVAIADRAAIYPILKRRLKK